MSDFVNLLIEEKSKALTRLATVIKKKDEASIKKACSDFVTLMDMFEFSTRKKIHDVTPDENKKEKRYTKGTLSNPFTSLQELKSFQETRILREEDFSEETTFVKHKTHGIFQVSSGENTQNFDTHVYHVEFGGDRITYQDERHVARCKTSTRLEEVHWHTVENAILYGKTWHEYH